MGEKEKRRPADSLLLQFQLLRVPSVYGSFHLVQSEGLESKPDLKTGLRP